MTAPDRPADTLTPPPPADVELPAARPFPDNGSTRSFVVPADDGRRAVQVSATALFLLRSAREGRPLPEIAARLSESSARDVGVVEVERAYSEVLAALDRGPTARAAGRPGSWLVVPLVPAGVVRAVARPLARLLAAPAVLCAVAAAALIPAALFAGADGPVTGRDGLLGYLVFVGLLVLHEFGHAAATVRGGGRPAAIGFLVYLVWPCFYTDVTDSWRLGRGRRIAVDVGGIYIQLIGTELVALAALTTGSQPLRVALVFSLVSIGFTLNPFLKFDGYWLLADALGVSDLHRSGRQAVVEVLWRRSSPPTVQPRRIRTVLVAYTLTAWAVWGALLVWSVTVVVTGVGRAPAQFTQLLHEPTLAATGRLLATLFAVAVVVIAGFRLAGSVASRWNGVRKVALR
jgi:putative peptide zinc metalloprotease protein